MFLFRCVFCVPDRETELEGSKEGRSKKDSGYTVTLNSKLLITRLHHDFNGVLRSLSEGPFKGTQGHMRRAIKATLGVLRALVNMGL